MTVSNTNTKVRYQTNGIVTQFGFNFYLNEEEQVKAVTTDDAGVETEFTQFTLTLNPDGDGGTLTTTTSQPLDNVTLTIYRETELTQETDYQRGGKFPAESHEQALDKLTQIDQELQEQIDRSLQSSIGNEVPYQLGTLEPGFFLRLRPDGVIIDSAEVDAENIMNKRPTAEENDVVVFDDTGNSKSSNVSIDELVAGVAPSPVSESIGLTDGQTTVTLTIPLDSFYRVFVSNNGVIDGQELIQGIHYTETSSTEIELLDSYPLGTIVKVEQNAYHGAGQQPSLAITDYTFPTEAELIASPLPVGTTATVTDLGNAKYVIRDASYVNLPGDKTLNNGSKAELQPDLNGHWSVLNFGAFDDTADSSLIQTPFFELAAQRAALANYSSSGGDVDVPAGRYRITDPTTTVANWWLGTDVAFTGVPTVPPTGQRDLSNLSGKVVRVISTSGDGMLAYGDGGLTFQKVTGRAQTTGVINGDSNTGKTGISGSTFTSIKTVEDSGTIAKKGLALVDNEAIKIGAWGDYTEIVKTENALGNALGMEVAVVNRNPAVADFTPATGLAEIDGEFSIAYWASSGLRQASDQPCSAFAGCFANPNAEFKRGIVFRFDSLETGEALCVSRNEEVCWYDDRTAIGGSGEKLTFIAGGTGTGPGNLGRFSVNLRNDAGDAFEQHHFNTVNLYYSIDNQASVGRTDNRYTTIYLQNSPDVVSDEAIKTDKQALSDAELAIGWELAKSVKSFKWNEEIQAKQGTDETVYTHYSVMAQKVWELYEAHGLDPEQYGIVMKRDGKWSINQNEIAMLMSAATAHKLEELING